MQKRPSQTYPWKSDINQQERYSNNNFFISILNQQDKMHLNSNNIHWNKLFLTEFRISKTQDTVF